MELIGVLLFSAATLKRNAMLDHYHLGAYGQIHHRKWSCCNATDRNTQGCHQTITQSRARRMSSPGAVSHSGSKGTQYEVSLLRGNPIKTQPQSISPLPVSPQEDRRYSLATTSVTDSTLLDKSLLQHSNSLNGSTE